MRRSLRRLDRVFDTLVAEREDPRIHISTVRASSLLRVRRRTRVKFWLSRTWFRLRHGREALRIMDEVSYAVEREFLYGQEHRL